MGGENQLSHRFDINHWKMALAHSHPVHDASCGETTEITEKVCGKSLIWF